MLKIVLIGHVTISDSNHHAKLLNLYKGSLSLSYFVPCLNFLQKCDISHLLTCIVKTGVSTEGKSREKQVKDSVYPAK